MPSQTSGGSASTRATSPRCSSATGATMKTAATATTVSSPRRNSGALPVAKCATTPSIVSPMTGSICATQRPHRDRICLP